MSKQEFLQRLRGALAGLPQEDIAERMTFYSEMIDDRIEDGLTEEEAVAEIGAVEDISAQIVAETPFPKLVKEKLRKKQSLRAWELILLVLGSPIWLSLLIAAFAVILSVYVVIWSVIISLWAVEVSFIVCAFAAVIAGIFFAFRGQGMFGVVLISCGIVLAGLSIFLFFGCREVSRGILVLTKKIALGCKSMFIGRNEENE